MRILITGISGLVGTAAARSLAAGGHEIVGVDRREPSAGRPGEFILGDLRDAETARRACARADAIVHSAAVQYHDGIPRRKREAQFSENVTATQALVEAARSAPPKTIVFLSSDMVYGLPSGRPLRETDPLRPIGPYGRSKVACEILIEGERSRGVRVVILRPRLIIGPGRLGVLRRLFDRVRAGKAVPMIGSGAGRYQMVSVTDVVRAVTCALESTREGTFNLGSQSPPSVRELLAELIRRAESRSRLVAAPAPLVLGALGVLDLAGLSPMSPEQYRLAPTDYALDTSRAADELGWRSTDTDAEMLWQAYAAYVGDRRSLIVAQGSGPASIAAQPQHHPRRTSTSAGERR